MSEPIEFAALAARNILIAFASLAIIGLGTAILVGVLITARNISRHLWRRNIRNAARFATAAAITASEATDQDRNRPIDNYPRIRDGGWWLISSGVIQVAIGFWFVYRAWQGMDPGRSALMAFLMGATAMALYFGEVSD